MRTMKLTAATTLVALVFLSSFAFIPATNAQSNNGVWKITTGGTLTGSSYTGSWFQGMCTLVGASSGTSGGCVINIYFNTPLSRFSCTLVLDVTGWTIGWADHTPGFVVTSGHAAASTPSQSDSEFCVVSPFNAGTVNPVTGNFVNPLFTMIPPAPGHYQRSMYGQLQADSTADVTFVS